MDLADLLLFVHLAAVAAAFFLGGVLHVSEWQVRYATSMQELRLVTRPFKWGALFGPILLVILLAGGALAGREDFDMGEAWLWTSVVGTLVLLVDGPVVMAPHGKELGKAYAEAGDGPIPPAVRALVCEPRTWVVGHMNTGLALAIVFNMVVKPDTVGAVLALLVGSGLGGWVGLQRSKAALAGPAVKA